MSESNGNEDRMGTPTPYLRNETWPEERIPTDPDLDIPKPLGDVRTTTGGIILETQKIHDAIQRRLDKMEPSKARWIKELYIYYIGKYTANAVRRAEMLGQNPDKDKVRKEQEENFGCMALQLAENDYESALRLRRLEEAERTLQRQTKEIITLQREKEINPLTGLTNREGAEKMYGLIREKEKEGKLKGHTVIVRMDIDNFKFINHALGHSGADEILKHIAQAIKESVKATDTIQFNEDAGGLHFTGDEFGIILTDVQTEKSEEGKKIKTLEEIVEMIIKRVMQKLEQIEYTYINNLGEKVKEYVTASAGYYIVPKGGTNPFKTVDGLADTAAEKSKELKTAKDREFSKGSNRIINFAEVDKILEKFNITAEQAAAAKFEAGMLRSKNDFLTHAEKIKMSRKGIENVLRYLDNATTLIREGGGSKRLIMVTISSLTEQIANSGWDEERIRRAIKKTEELLDIALEK